MALTMPIRNMFTRPTFMDFYPPQPPVARASPMKVLVLGLSRTGTSTLCEAFRILGLNPYHFMECIRNVNNGHFQYWDAAILSKYHASGCNPLSSSPASRLPIDFEYALSAYDSTTDAPTCLFPDELLAAYPTAKVILTSRPPNSWLQSMRQTVLEILRWRSWTLLAYLDPDYSGGYWTMFNHATEVWSYGNPPWKQAADSDLLRYYDEYYDHVRKVVPKEKLLEFHPADGWEPLCAFLGVDAPERKFPHVNETALFVAAHRRVYWWRWGVVLRNVGKTCSFIIALAGVQWWWYRVQR